MPDLPVLYEEDGHVAIITLNRPPKNLWSEEVAQLLHQALCRLAEGEARVGVICANGDNFTMGADLYDFPKDVGLCIPGAGAPSSKPLVAAVNGWCLGASISLIQMCDLCVASASTKFKYPEAKLGVAMGMIAGMVSRIPHKVAMEMILLGEVIGAQRAYEVGLVNKVVADGEQLKAALEYARTLADNAPLVIARLRSLANKILPPNPAIEAYRSEAELAAMKNSQDFKEGIASLQQKRKATFTGK